MELDHGSFALTLCESTLALLAAASESGTGERESLAGWGGRLEYIDAFLLLLAKAVRQLHDYPVTSLVCEDAIQACLAHIRVMEGFDTVAISVAPNSLVAHDHPVGNVALVTHELSRRLRRARVSDFAIAREASSRDLARFCVNLARCSESSTLPLSLSDLLAEDGVEAVRATTISRRTVLGVGAVAPAQRDLVAHERRRRSEAELTSMNSAHLFPAHRGWIRLDPAEEYDGLSLADLAILVSEPQRLAGMLEDLVEGGSPGENADEGAFENRFSDIATMFAGLEPRLSRVMFGKLADAVLAMDPAPRKALLVKTILPAIFDGREDARVLPVFPDPDLAESLCLLWDHSAPTVVMSALDQLKLEPDRREIILPMMEQIIRAQQESAGGLDAGTMLAMDQHARRLTRIDSAGQRSFVELAAFDFRLDERATTVIAGVRNDICEVDEAMVEVRCLASLLSLQPNPEVAAPFLQAAARRVEALASDGRWPAVADALERLAMVRARISDRRPEIVAIIDAELMTIASRQVLKALLEQHALGADRAVVALRVIDALGASVAPALVETLPLGGAISSAATTLMCERPQLVVHLLSDMAASAGAETRHLIARVLGHAGAGHEHLLGAMLDPRDERTTREALRALSRIATARAATVVSRAARDARGWMGTATIETLLRYPPELLAPAVLDLLGDRAFVLSHPEAAARLLGRAGQAGDHSLEPVLKGLWSLRFRFWNRAVVNVAREAGTMLRQA